MMRISRMSRPCRAPEETKLSSLSAVVEPLDSQVQSLLDVVSYIVTPDEHPGLVQWGNIPLVAVNFGGNLICVLLRAIVARSVEKNVVI